MQNVDLSFDNFYETINAVLDKHAHLSKIVKIYLEIKNETLDNYWYS